MTNSFVPILYYLWNCWWSPAVLRTTLATVAPLVDQRLVTAHCSPPWGGHVGHQVAAPRWLIVKVITGADILWSLTKCQYTCYMYSVIVRNVSFRFLIENSFKLSLSILTIPRSSAPPQILIKFGCYLFTAHTSSLFLPFSPLQTLLNFLITVSLQFCYTHTSHDNNMPVIIYTFS